ncbi:Hypothetical protein D9617_3g019060 [Elsinoe fawcettii]|nr:Hypothetical protein D9617_3g019060 [Elsinoe fawcettii]
MADGASTSKLAKRKAPDAEQYTIGWISALEIEYSAARFFVEAEHDLPDDRSINDNNTYTVGSIGKHNIVIAVCPDGEYGTTSAATVALDMVHSFPNVRLGLMVGIGGGAPSPKNDIRLGDVVVSSARSASSGVFQYDMGKRIQDQDVLTTGALNRSPVLLRTAVSDLASRIDTDGHRIKETIDQILSSRTKRVRAKFSRPPLDSDRLFKPGYVLSESGTEADIAAMVRRPARLVDDGDLDPEIHYGLVASANQLMKDAKQRDQLSQRHDVKCFEMEAAGLMNHFPCLIIRGICDYSDTHKNDTWHGYAAMTAAAYATMLISRLATSPIENLVAVREILLNGSKVIPRAVEQTTDR